MSTIIVNKIQQVVDEFQKEKIIPEIFVERTDKSMDNLSTNHILIFPSKDIDTFSDVWDNYEIFTNGNVEEIFNFIKNKLPKAKWKIFKLNKVV